MKSVMAPMVEGLHQLAWVERLNDLSVAPVPIRQRLALFAPGLEHLAYHYCVRAAGVTRFDPAIEIRQRVDQDGRAGDRRARSQASEAIDVLRRAPGKTIRQVRLPGAQHRDGKCARIAYHRQNAKIVLDAHQYQRRVE